MGLLAKLLRRSPPMATPDELAVARHILAGDDERLGLLARQLAYAPVTRSHPDETSFSVAPDYTTDDLSFPLEVMRLESGWVPILDLHSGQVLEFRVVVVRGAFLKGLEGRTADGRAWPERWQPDLSSPVDGAQRLHLPDREAVDAQQRQARLDLERWIDHAIQAGIETFSPASEVQMAARELALGGRFPDGLRAFFAITDGLESNDLRLFGHADAYTVDSKDLPALLVAFDADNADDYVVVVSLTGSDENVYRMNVHDKDPTPVVIAPTFRTYLAERLR